LTDFDNFRIIGNRNKYSTKQIQMISLQPYYVSTLPDITENSTKTANRFTVAFIGTDCSKILQKVVQCPFLSVFVRTFL